MKLKLLSVKNWAILCCCTSIFIVLFSIIRLFRPISYPVVLIIPIIFVLISIFGFYIISAIDTKDKQTKINSILAGMGALGVLAFYINRLILYNSTPKDYWNDDKCQLHQFCLEYSGLFKCMSILGCILMALFFIYLFLRSQCTLKLTCIPAIIGCILISLDIIIFRGIIILTPLAAVIFILYAISFYKLYKKL